MTLEGTRALESDTAELRSWSFVSCVAVSLLLNLSESQFHLLTHLERKVMCKSLDFSVHARGAKDREAWHAAVHTVAKSQI